MAHTPLAVAALAVQSSLTGKEFSQSSEPVYGGYANARGEIVLFVKDGAYRVNFKSQTLQKRPVLNSGAQARYDATEAGDDFEFGSKTFRRLTHEQIVGICASNLFRVISIPVR